MFSATLSCCEEDDGKILSETRHPINGQIWVLNRHDREYASLQSHIFGLDLYRSYVIETFL